MRPTRKLTYSRCQCSGCGEYFNSDTAFDKHRVGAFGIDRRCLSQSGMLAAGMVKNASDWWVSEPSERPFPDRTAAIESIPAENTGLGTT